jgi:uncharacterized membrane protein YccC
VPDLARLPIALNLRAISLVEGVRAALAVAAIIALNERLNSIALHEAALAALLTCICDPGGPIRRRLPVLLSFTALGALITGGVGLLRGFGMPVALPVGAVILFALCFVRIYGQAPQQLGALLSTVLILTLDRPLPDIAAALTRGGGFIIGAFWATLLTLVIWRIHPYLPARRAVAEVYRTLGLLTGDLRHLVLADTRDDAAWEAHAREHRRAARDAIEAARGAMLDTLRARGAGTHRGMQSLIRLETADQLFGALIALAEVAETASATTSRAAARLLRRLRPLLETLGRAIVSDDAAANQQIGRSIDAIAAEADALPATEKLRPIAERIVERLRIAQTLAVPQNFLPGFTSTGQRTPPLRRLLRPLRANLNWQSPALRHSLRAALAATPALAFTMLWFTPYDHWLTITLVATMQPYFALTWARALERVVGTALGGLVAAAVGLLCTTPMAIAAAMFPLSVAAFAVRSVSLGMFMAALTPLVVLLVETSQPGTSEWLIAAARAGFTTLGGTMAVLSCFVLWPSWEPKRLLAETLAAIAAHGRYAEAELAFLEGEASVAVVEAARRAAGLASNSLEASISRALSEPATLARDRLEAALVIDAALRRMAGRLSAMQLDPGLHEALQPEALAAWRTWVGGATADLAAGRGEVAPRPEVAGVDALLRIARQIELIAGAMERLTA